MTNLSDFQKKIGVKFKNQDLLALAFIHRSYINENKSEQIQHNERLEFLGDAVLELVTTEFLYERFPEKPEGELTNHRSALVKGVHLAKVARKIGVGEFLQMSKGEEASGGRKKDYLLANAVEAIIGAIYLDKGYKESKKFIEKYILVSIDEILEKKLHVDAKSNFQEISQEKRGITPTYEVISEEGPDHNKKFTMGAYIGEEKIAEGKGSSKQTAEQDAARNALVKLNWN